MKTMTKDEKLALLKLPLDEKIKRTFNMRQEFYDLAKKIADWHTVTFKDADKAGRLLKLDEEFDEWREETADPEKRITELADCFILASALWFRFEAAIGMFTCKAIVKHCANADGELYDAIIAKMEVNKERTRKGLWKKLPDGREHH